jgi:glycine betaine/proline transport system substrate-binding protein
MLRAFLTLLLSFGLVAAAMAQEAPSDAQPAAGEEAEAAPAPPPCGTEPISIARMQWPSSAILAYIHAELLTAELGCAVQVVAGDLSATTSSMATTGRPLVAPEIWLGRVAQIWNSTLETGRIRQAAPTFMGGDLEAWFVPDYVIKDNPSLASAADLADHWQVFANSGGRATFLSCPADWACAVINRNLLKAFGLTDRFDIREPASRFELDAALGEAVSRHEPVLFYYWQPNGVLAQLGFKPLDMGAFDAKAVACLASATCATPTPSSFPAEQVVIAISDDLFTLSPMLVSYFQRATMPLDEMNKLLAHLSETGGTPEDAAQLFVDTRAEIWTPWVAR